MIYVYEDVETGEKVDIVKSVAESDPIGAIIEHEGRRLKRVVSIKSHQIGPEDRPRSRNALPRWLPGCSAYDSKGRPFITNAEGKKMGLVENPHLDNND